MKVTYILVLLIIILLLGVGLYLYTGMYNFAATSPHNEITEMIIHESIEKSVRNHARNINAPILNDKQMVNEGFIAYDAMCAMCHGAPGLPGSVLHKGLYPEPPELYEDDDEWSDEELFWIVKNGIKMTGMPAYGPTHSDEDIWPIVAFLKELPELSTEDYKTLIERNKNSEGLHSHQHNQNDIENKKSESEEINKENVHIHKDGEKHVH